MNQIETEGFPFKMDHFPWFFPSIAEYSSLMEQVGFRVTFAHRFDRPTPLDGDRAIRNWIDMIGSSMFEGILDDSKVRIISQVENKLKDILYKDGSWIINYKRIRVIGIKE
ncbi:hypothetical protein [Bacillus sp. ISL-7]|uniref:hypothetical protein n=1 Tax=Bacillus sp. ISL-7 TaxID=2819136 RepID=UPI001BE7CB75|nr:hypothetical protein [Bacillus sp. ISL-7]MBT2737872.1 hypothetical protein [Bacillus sp. ISL-7]